MQENIISQEKINEKYYLLTNSDILPLDNYNTQVAGTAKEIIKFLNKEFNENMLNSKENNKYLSYEIEKSKELIKEINQSYKENDVIILADDPYYSDFLIIRNLSETLMTLNNAIKDQIYINQNFNSLNKDQIYEFKTNNSDLILGQKEDVLKYLKENNSTYSDELIKNIYTYIKSPNDVIEIVNNKRLELNRDNTVYRIKSILKLEENLNRDVFDEEDRNRSEKSFNTNFSEEEPEQ